MQPTLFENPLREGLRLERTPEPCCVVIFGASGDLTMRKLIPAFFSLFQQNLLPPGFSVIGAARTPMSHQDFRDKMKEAIKVFGQVTAADTHLLENFVSGLFYNRTDVKKPETLERLCALLSQMDRERGTAANRLFYLSTPPTLYSPISKALGEFKLNHSQGWTRIIIEKPFGRDLESMRSLNRDVLSVFEEDQVYRIDHYLGKETVQNIMVLRFANGIFEPLWDRGYIDHIQITAAESLGVEKRGGYYEQAGAVRDMIQNHLFQVFSLVAMEPPSSLQSNDVRDEKTKVMKAVRPIQQEEVSALAVRGQYGKGAIDGKPVVGYRQEENVNPDSCTETYAALKLLVENWRWAGVPFYLRSAKRMPKRVTEVAVQFRRAPHLIFHDPTSAPVEPNALIIRVQPQEGITLRFRAKVPSQAIQIRTVNMDFHYGTSFGKKSPQAYERLLLDAMLGDTTLFARGDMVEISWKLLTPILEAWGERQADDFPNYEAGSWGPEVSEKWLLEEGRRWRRP
ncbi:MAG: glucose-6-phosphate dehydrogenase [Acidobacteriota bacterium]